MDALLLKLSERERRPVHSRNSALVRLAARAALARALGVDEARIEVVCGGGTEGTGTARSTDRRPTGSLSAPREPLAPRTVVGLGDPALRAPSRAGRAGTLESARAVPQQHRYPEALEVRVAHVRLSPRPS